MGKKLIFNDLIGKRFGQLTILSEEKNKLHKRTTSKCLCDCGKEYIVTLNAIMKGNTKSCGCIRLNKPNNLSHNLRGHSLYSTWANIKQRCYNPKFTKYGDYGGRGIVVCENWRDSFINFYDWAINNGWVKGLEIDRINNDGNYSPKNCKFSTRKENMNNTRANTLIDFNGEVKTLSEWSDHLNIPYSRLMQRITKLNMPLELAFSNKKLKRRFHKKIEY